MITTDQIKKLHTILTAKGISAEYKYYLLDKRYKIKSSKELTKENAIDFIEYLETMVTPVNQFIDNRTDEQKKTEIQDWKHIIKMMPDIKSLEKLSKVIAEEPDQIIKITLRPVYIQKLKELKGL